jgi:hypothetical protein
MSVAYHEHPNIAVTAAGSTLATATLLQDKFNVVTTVAASTGVSLPANSAVGETVFVKNAGANALAVYPSTATGTIQGGSAGAALSLATTNDKTKNAFFVHQGSDVWSAFVSA